MIEYKALDFDKVKNIIAGYTPILESKDVILKERIVFNPLIINRKLAETKEFLEFIKNENTISFDGIVSPFDILNKAKKNITLSSSEIYQFYVFHNHCNRIKNLINKNESLPLIKEYTDSISIDDYIDKIAGKIIDANGGVRSDATEELKRINLEINDILSNINVFCNNFIKENADLLQETNVSERNNRFVFLFKNTYKNKFEGYDYGSSGSGQASYIEPSPLVKFNNKKNELEDLRNEEIERILADTTRLISNLSSIYVNNFKIITTISTIYAKAYYGYVCTGCIGQLSDHLYIENVKHPLIDHDKVVANTYSIPSDKKGIIISGSNTGGKTVSLKVIGLSICMTYLGIPVSASKVEVPLYDKIFVDIDTNQSIKDSLSTFSAHLSLLNSVVNEATNKSIVLIDELISGTDPKEAEAISLSLIKRLLNIGACLIATTHYGLIKKFAYESNNLILSSVEFDKNSLQPTYHYIENSIGDSNALDIATRYLNDNYIIDEARKILELNKSDDDKAFNDLALKMTEIETLKKNLEEKEHTILVREKELDNRIQEFDASVKDKKNEIIENFNKELEGIKDDIEAKVEEASSAKELTKISKNIEEIDLIEDDNNYEYKVGDRVRVNDIGNPGFITKIDGDKVEVDVNGITLHTELKSLTLLPKVEKKEVIHEINMDEAPSELVLIGQRVEEALKNLDDYLDKARLANSKKVRIIHGIGTLTLKSAIWNHLLNVDFVDKYYLADYFDGGSAVTVIELK